MRYISALGLLCASLAPLAASQTIPRSEYRFRRAALQKSLDGILVLFGKTVGSDEVFGFVQDSAFYYLTGWTQPGAILLLDKNTEVLFLPHHNQRAEVYTGPKLSAEDPDAAGIAGFDQVMPVEKFESQLAHSLATAEKIYTLPKHPDAGKLAAALAFREISDAGPLIAKLRIKKSEAEIAAIQHATDVSVQAHRAAWKRMQAGLYEYQIAATLSDTFLENGCERDAYSPIVGSGPNSTVLHYSSNRRRMDRGEVVVMDAAAECGYYASDITRTVPVGGARPDLTAATCGELSASISSRRSNS